MFADGVLGWFPDGLGMVLGRFGKCFVILLGWLVSVWEWFGDHSSSPVFWLFSKSLHHVADGLKELEVACYPGTWVPVHPGTQIPRDPGAWILVSR